MKKNVEFRQVHITTDDELKLHGRLPYNVESLDLGGFKEKINPSAFKKTLQEREVKLLLNHNRENLLARTSNGSLRVYDTGEAIEWDAVLVDIPENHSLWAKVKSGLYSQISFGFRCIRDKWTNGGRSRELLECALEEFSIVDDGAYGVPATVTCRSLSEALKGQELDEANLTEVKEEIERLRLLLPQEEKPVEEIEEVKVEEEIKEAEENPTEEPVPQVQEETVLKSEYDSLLKEYNEAIDSFTEELNKLKEAI